MDLKNDTVIPKCTSCNQKFSITKISPIKGRIPLILPCTHSICELCCKDVVKKSHKVECGICRDVYNLSPTDVITLKTDEQAVRSIFSINYHMMGVLAWQYGNQSLQPPFASFNPAFKQKETKLSPIIIPSTETCSHCNGGADFKCEQCDDFLCAHCFSITHGSYAPLQKHKKVPVGSFNLIKSLTVCATHNDKSLEFYCEDCKKYICFNCMFTQTHCSTHKVKALAEWNSAMYEDVVAQRAVADETFRRLNKSLTDIADLQKPKATGNVTIHKDSAETIKIVNHYMRCHAALQVQEKAFLKTLNTTADRENKELTEAKQTVIKNLIEVDQLLNVVDYALTEENRVKVNLMGLSEKLAVVVDIPWFVYKDYGQAVSESKPSITIDDASFDEGLKKHVTVSDGNTLKYKILPTNEIPQGIEVPPAPETVIVSEYTIAKEIKNQQNIAKAVQELSAMNIADNHSTTNSVLSSNSSSMKESAPLAQQNRFQLSQHESNQVLAYPLPAGAPLQMPKRNPNQAYTNKNKRNNRGGTNSNYVKNSLLGQQFSQPNNFQVPPPGYQMPNYQRETPHQKMMSFTPKPQKTRAFSDLEPKPMELGSVEIVAVASILNPHNFYIQRSASVQKLTEMSASFQISVPDVPPPPADKILDTLVIVSHQNTLYRGKVLSIQEDKYRIFQVDYGNIINATFNQLRSLPELYHEMPWLAMKCKLIKCDPIAEGKWSPENTDFMKKLINSKPVVMHVVAIRKIQNQPAETVLEVNVALQEDSKEFAVDVADALIYNRQAVHSNKSIKIQKKPQYAQMMYGGNFARPNFFPANIPVKKSLITVKITHMEHPGKFYVRKIDNETEFVDLTRALSAEYELAVNSGNVYLPEVGMCVACNMAMYTGDELDYNGPISGDCGTWFRARIIAVRSGLMVRVFLVDTGHIVNVSCLAIRKLTSSFLRMNMLAAECVLFEVAPTNNNWSEESLEFMREAAKKPMKMWPAANKKNQRYNHVILYDVKDETKPSVNAQLVEAGYAIATGSTIIDTNMATSSAASVTMKTVVRPKEEPPKDIFEDGVSRIEVEVLDIKSPSQIYLSFAEDYAKLRALTENMKDFYETTEPFSKLNWMENDRCAVNDPNKGWCRGRIVKVDSDAEVFLADHAVNVKMPLDSLRVLDDDFLAAKEAILCHMSGVAKATDGEWPMLTCEFLRDMVAACKQIFISKGGEILGKSFPVEMWTVETKAVEALEPAIKEWIKLNKKLVDQGLALPTDNKKRSLFDTLGGGPQVIDEWLQIHNIENKTGDGTIGSTVRMFTEWLKPLPLPIETFDAIPTYVDNNLDVYLHNVEAEHTLDFIKTELERRFKDSKPSPKDKYWSIGQPCIAEFVLDKSYYRAKILEVNDDIVKVQFVDYGNEETCDISKVRKAAVLCDIPIQCSRGRLLENEPKPGEFEQTHMDMLHKTLVDNRVTVTVLNALESDLYSVKLIVNNEIFNISEMIKYLNIFAATTVDRMPVVKTEVKSPEQDDSEPDLIYDTSGDEKQELKDSDESEDLTWVELADRDRKREMARLCKYDKNSFADGASFQGVVEEIVNGTTLCLRILSDKYEALMADLQKEAAMQPRVLEIFEYKPCVALYEEDEMWYRAIILEFDNVKKVMRVLFIDYGNIELVFMKNVRDSHPRWCEIPRCAIHACINNTTVSHNTSEMEVAAILKESLLLKEFNGKIIALSDDASDPIESYIVELYDTDTGEPAYQSLYDQKVLKCGSEYNFLK